MVSIIIRTKNEAVFIGRTLEAICRQDFQEVETIIVDSGSEDATLSIAQAYASKIITIPPESFTYGYALNIGAGAAEGEYIVALSAHALPANHQWLSELLLPLENPLVAAASSRQIPHPGQKLETYLVFWQQLYALRIRTLVVNRYLFSNASSVFRAKLWREHPFDETVLYCEDHRWALHTQKLGYQIAYVPTSVVFHSHQVPLWAKVKRGWGELKSVVKIYYDT
jgi:rhamnosyltransferase